MRSFSLREYRLFVQEELSESSTELRSDLWHVLSYQKYCFDNILGYSIKYQYHNHLISFIKDVALYRSLDPKEELDDESKLLLEKKFKFKGINEICPPRLCNVLWDYISKMNDDLRFNDLAFDYLRMHIGITIIDLRKDELSDLEYIFLTKIINSAADSWVAQFREMTIDFNLIVRNVYKLLPRRFLKIH